MYNSMLDAVGYLIAVGVLGSFAFWLIGYFAYELIVHLIRGPSDQLRSVGTSVLDAPPIMKKVTSLVPPKAA